MVNLSASALTTIFVARLFNSTMIGVGTGILTFLVLLFGEIVPKSLAALYSLPMSLFYSGPAYMLSLILSPLIWVLNKISRGIFRLFRIDPDVNPDQMTESELRMIVDVSHEEGVIEKEEQEMITNVVDFGDAVARDIMVPRADMTTAQITAGYDELLKQLRQDNYSRIPIYEDSRDHIVGILHVKDLILYAERHGKENVDISRIMRKPVYVYEYQRTTQIFKDMKASSTTMCIVLDEYGITAGLITTEDLIEEIVGDIRDEYDASEAERIIKRPDGSYDVDGGMKLDDLKDALDVPFESEYYDSVGGLMIELLDRHPMEGDEVENDVASFRAIKVEKNRPSRVLIRVKKKPVEEENGGE